MKNIREQVKITDCERLSNSYMGNPRYKVFVENKDKLFTLKTALNGLVGYKFDYSFVGKAAFITYHVTATGSLIMTDIESC